MLPAEVPQHRLRMGITMLTSSSGPQALSSQGLLAHSACSHTLGHQQMACMDVQVRAQMRKIFTNMGFEEMPTNNYVESR